MKYLFSLSLFALPLVAQAEIRNLGDVLAWVLNIVNVYFIPLLVSLALLAFFWRNIVALVKKDELVSKAETKWYLFWGIIALFVMVSVWGLVGILADALGIKNVVPQLNTGDNPNDVNIPGCGVLADPETCNPGGEDGSPFFPVPPDYGGGTRP